MDVAVTEDVRKDFGPQAGAELLGPRQQSFDAGGIGQPESHEPRRGGTRKRGAWELSQPAAHEGCGGEGKILAAEQAVEARLESAVMDGTQCGAECPPLFIGQTDELGVFPVDEGVEHGRCAVVRIERASRVV